LGAEFAKVLAAAGARVVIGARRADRLTELAQLITAAGGQALPVAMDVRDKLSVQAAFDTAEAAWGTVEILVNNAGVSRAAYLTELQEDDWDTVLDTNLKAVWCVAAEAARRLQQSGVSGSIINISSALAFGVSKTLGAYMAAKAGVIQLTRAMAVEWAADNIRVNAIAPGYIPTEINEGFFTTPKGLEMISRIPQQRVGAPAELAGPLLLLASDASSYMTGSVLTVDGGHLCQQV
jgi:NAD(P)-dependent dehydrogenase (short-subunit alcohol dehydrogenase family)